VLTHGHEDHIGAVIELWPRLQCRSMQRTFRPHAAQQSLPEYGRGRKLPIREVELNARFRCWTIFRRADRVAHSIPESNALAIRSAMGTVLHTATGSSTRPR